MDPASAVFVLLLPAAAITAIQGARHRYFLRDEWILLAERRLVPADLLTDIGGHLVAIPLLFYRAVFSTRGIGSYMPYLVTIILLHLTVAGLQRVTMRRSGVRPWIATAAAALLLFLGNARENIVWAFQMTLVGSLAFGLAHLILADHAGRWDRRDAFGLAAGLAGILCSALGLTMVFCVGIATLLRRGWQIAVVHTLPLAGTYLLWSLISGGAGPPNISPTVLLEWNARASNATFRALGDSRGIGVALAVILILGWALAGRRRGFRSLFTGGSLLPLSLILGAVFFQTSTATQRSVFGAGPAASTRYIYISAVLILPGIAFALEEVAAVLNDKRLAALMTLCVLVPGIAGNAIELSRPLGPWNAPFFDWERDWVAAIPRMPQSRLVAPENRPEPNEAPWVTVGWLREALRSGRLGKPRDFGPMREAQVRSMILLNQQPGVVAGKCRRIRSETSLLLRRGAAVELRDPASITVLIDQQLVRNRPYGPSFWNASPQRLEATLRDLRLRISPRGSGSLVLCGPELPDPRPPAT